MSPLFVACGSSAALRPARSSEPPAGSPRQPTKRASPAPRTASTPTTGRRHLVRSTLCLAQTTSPCPAIREAPQSAHCHTGRLPCTNRRAPLGDRRPAGRAPPTDRRYPTSPCSSRLRRTSWPRPSGISRPPRRWPQASTSGRTTPPSHCPTRRDLTRARLPPPRQQAAEAASTPPPPPQDYRSLRGTLERAALTLRHFWQSTLTSQKPLQSRFQGADHQLPPPHPPSGRPRLSTRAPPGASRPGCSSQRPPC